MKAFESSLITASDGRELTMGIDVEFHDDGLVYIYAGNNNVPIWITEYDRPWGMVKYDVEQAVTDWAPTCIRQSVRHFNENEYQLQLEYQPVQELKFGLHIRRFMRIMAEYCDEAPAGEVVKYLAQGKKCVGHTEVEAV